MNIFYTHHNTDICASEHCDVHLNKMIIETAQLISTTVSIVDGVNGKELFYVKPTQSGHPCAVWMRSDLHNYKWSVDLLSSLLNEYSFRNKKEHKMTSTLLLFKSYGNPRINSVKFSTPPKCTQGAYQELCVEDAYKNYLNDKWKDWTTRTNKRRMKVTWKNRIVPIWVNF